MHNPLASAITRITHIIPRPVLETAFQSYRQFDTLDTCIKQQVILPRVQPDASIRGGKVHRFVLEERYAVYTPSPSIAVQTVPGNYTAYKIPPEAREFRDIAAILDCRPTYQMTIANPYCHEGFNTGNTATQLACQALKSQTMGGGLTYPVPSLAWGNVVRLSPIQSTYYPWAIRVRLAFDDEFSNMDISSIMPFAVLCEWATKAFIYNELMFRIETGVVRTGMEIGYMKEIVSSYSDANEKYDEALIEFGGAEIYDPMRLHSILAKMTPTA